MQCDEFLERWNDRLDQRLEPAGDPELAAHVDECAACRGLAASLGRALGMLEAIPAPSDRFAANILQALRSPASTVEDDVPLRATVEVASRTSAHRPSAWQWWAVAAAVLLMATVAWRFSDRRDVAPSGTQPIARQEPAPKTQPEAEAVATNAAPAWDELAADSQASARELADNTRRRLDDALAIASLWGSTNEPAAEASGSQQWYEGVAEGVSPLTDSTIGTWNVLRGLVAPSKESSL
ncbi:MAG: hypothetical protein QM775_12815 [Pirellulales bacterium]